MTEKTSEDLVFDKLKFPSMREIFNTQILDKKTDSLYFIESIDESHQVKKIKYNLIDTLFDDYEMVDISELGTRMPRLKKKGIK
jgi:hypothetical protein